MVLFGNEEEVVEDPEVLKELPVLFENNLRSEETFLINGLLL